MITLFAPPPGWGLPRISPASMKLEIWLRMAGVPYEAVPVDLSIAPKGKMPFVRIGGELVGDSTLIVERLSKELGKDMDRGLGRTDRAVSLAFRRMMKEDLYWVTAFDRWANDENFAVYARLLGDLMFAAMPEEHRMGVLASIRQGMLEQLRGQGMGRHRPEEVHAIGMADLSAVSDYLGDKPFFMGDEPTTADATVYAYVANAILVPLSSAVRDHGHALPNLVAYCERMRARWYPELSAPGAI